MPRDRRALALTLAQRGLTLGLIAVLSVVATGAAIFTRYHPLEVFYATERSDISVLLYHQISARGSARGGDLAYAEFERQMRRLHREGYQTVDVETWARATRGEAELPAKPVIITFHDQSAGWSTAVVPLLRELQFKAHFLPVVRVTPEEDDENATGWRRFAELVDMRNSAGERLFHLGTHTFQHASLARQPDEDWGAYRARVRHELVGSADVFEAKTGLRPRLFALPLGEGFADPEERRIIREVATGAGYIAGQSGRYYDEGSFWLGGMSHHQMWSSHLEFEFALRYPAHASCGTDFLIWLVTAVNRGIQKVYLAVLG